MRWFIGILLLLSPGFSLPGELAAENCNSCGPVRIAQAVIDPFTTFASAAGQAAQDLDGATDFYSRSSDFSGNADSKKMMLSLWFISDEDGTFQRLVYSDNGAYHILKGPGNVFGCIALNTSSTIVVNFSTISTFLADSSWHHILIGFNTTTGSTEQYVYVDGASASLTVTTFTADGIADFTRNNHYVGGTNLGADWNGCLSEIWFGPGEFLTGPEAIAKFYDAGQPMPLGAFGQFVTGTAPLVYSPSANPEVDQQGSGGVYVEQGTPVACSTEPS